MTAHVARHRGPVGGRPASRSPSPSASTSIGSTSTRRVAEHLGERAGVAGDDGHAGTHRLERREAESLVDRRIREHRRAGEEVGAVASSTNPSCTIRSRARPLSIADCTRAESHPAGPASTRRKLVDRRAAMRSNAVTSVVRFFRGSIVPSASTYRSAGEPPRPRPRRPAGPSGLPEWIATTRSAGAPEQLADLGRHELARGVDRGAPVRSRVRCSAG